MQAGRIHVTYSYLTRYREFRIYLQSLRKRTKPNPQTDPADSAESADGADTADATHTEAPTAADNAAPLEEAPEDSIAAAQHAINARLENDLLQKILSQDFAFFVRLVIKFLEAMGYGRNNFHTIKRVTCAGGDGGIDGELHEDPLGFNVIYTQAKRYTNKKVGSPEMHQFIGALSGYPANSKGLFITTSDFTKQAQQAAGTAQKNLRFVSRSLPSAASRLGEIHQQIGRSPQKLNFLRTLGLHYPAECV